MKFLYPLIVECETLEEAEQVVSERIHYDEFLAFDYRITVGAAEVIEEDSRNV